jgi:hypothetical protein
MTQQQVSNLAVAVAEAARQIKSALVVVDQVIANNSVNDPGWGSLDHANNPDLIDENELVIGTQHTPDNISAAIGSLQQFANVWSGAAGVTQSAWGQNIERIVDPIV